MKNAGNWIALAALALSVVGGVIAVTSRQAVTDAAVQRIDATVSEVLAITKGLEIGQAVLKARVGLAD